MMLPISLSSRSLSRRTWLLNIDLTLDLLTPRSCKLLTSILSLYPFCCNCSEVSIYAKLFCLCSTLASVHPSCVSLPSILSKSPWIKLPPWTEHNPREDTFSRSWHILWGVFASITNFASFQKPIGYSTRVLKLLVCLSVFLSRLWALQTRLFVSLAYNIWKHKKHKKTKSLSEPGYWI